MDSTNNNNNQMFLCEFKELRNELSAVKKRIVQLEESHEKQQERINKLEGENHALKNKKQINIDGNKEGGLMLNVKRMDQFDKEENESKSTSVSTTASAGKKKTKTNNNDDDEAVVVPRYDNGDSFGSLSDDLLHKIVEFHGSGYSVFGLINKRCNNIYDVKEYKLKKQTCVFGYGTVDMMLENFLKQRRDVEEELDYDELSPIAETVICFNRLDAIDWMIRLGDYYLLDRVCFFAAWYGRINILSRVFLKCNLTMLDQLIDDDLDLCLQAARNGHLETLKWLRKYGARWNADTFYYARENGHDEVVQYLRNEGCPETFEGDY